MNKVERRLTREEFYDRIWSTPIVKLGQELGYSYLEMVQLCEQLKVPRPDGGYWYRRQHGGVDERIALPPPAPDTPCEIKPGPRLPQGDETPPSAADVTIAPSSEFMAPQNLLLKADVRPASPSAAHRGADARASAGNGQSSPTKKPAEPIPQSGTNKSDSSKPAVMQFTRGELYEAVWSKSCQKLAAELGISDVALAKTCRRMGIPRPSLGYWARVAAGEKVPRKPLPPAGKGQDRTVTFDITANRQRREAWQASNGDLEALATDLAIPGDGAELHPAAQRHSVALRKAKVSEDGFVSVSGRDLFRCDLTPSSAGRLCRALAAMFVELEARGYKFKSGVDQFAGLRVTKGSDDLTIACTEGREQVEREPTAEDKRKPSWTWQLKSSRSTGKLSFEVLARGLRGRRTWTESESKPLEEVLGIVVEKVDAAFQNFEEQRQLEIETAKRREAEAKRAAEEWERRQKAESERDCKRQHESKLAEIAQIRRDNLSAAAHAWMESGLVRAYVDECERSWHQKGELSLEQEAWIAWAREEATRLCPPRYPDPATDGRFDPSFIPFGGPYPEAEPLPKKKTPEPVQPEVQTLFVEHPSQYPFWLRNHGR